ncbi:MAG: response regulator [Gammaproteobacteria bacterium]|nr:response regulator [Gammaproteobacteria bacterium]
MKEDVSKKLLTPNDVAELLLVSPTTVRFWAHKGALKALTTPGGHRRFNYEDVEAFANSRGMDLQRDSDKTRILIVDDEEVLGEFLVEFFKSVEGVETEVANYSFEAGLKYKSFKPQIVLLDIMMPGLNGFQVCKMMKADPLSKDVRIIAMTGYPSNENVEKILSAGAEACLQKPIDTTQLLDLLDLKLKQPPNVASA